MFTASRSEPIISLCFVLLRIPNLLRGSLRDEKMVKAGFKEE
jgi:hypothetical protein